MGMPGEIGQTGASRSVTAFFDTKDDADTARRDLIQAGIPVDDIHVAGGEPAAASPPHPHGFWESLKELFLPEEDRFAYAEGLRRGGYTVSVRTDEAAYDNAIDILDRDGAVDMDEREAGWRGEGWTGGPEQDEEPSYRPAGAGTAGFGASAADRFPTASGAPPLVDVAADKRIDDPRSAYAPENAKFDPGSSATPDAAHAPYVPGLGRNDAPGAGLPAGRPGRGVMRDLSHGRSRIRSYVRADSGTDAADEAARPAPGAER